MLLNFVLSFISVFLILGKGFAFQIEVEGLKSMDKKEFLYLLDLHESYELDEQRITDGIKRVFLKDIFEDIVVERVGDKLKISVREKPLIKSVEFSGNKIFDSSFLRKLLTFRTNDRIKESELRKSAQKIQDELKIRGYTRAKVSYEKDCRDDTCIVKFTVDEGIPTLVERITWKGDIDDALAEILDIREGEPFDIKKVEGSIEKAKEYFTKRGIIGTEIKYSFRDGELVIELKRGYSIEFEFLGVEEINLKKLEETVKAHFENRVDENAIRDSVNSLISLYRTNGFIDIRIDCLVEKNADTIKVTYVVNEGKRRTVEDIEFVFSGKVLEIIIEEIMRVLVNQRNKPFNPDEIDGDKKTIIDFLKSRGYIDAKIESVEVVEGEEVVKIIYRISEGSLVRISKVNLLVGTEIVPTKVKTLLKEVEGKPFSDSVFLEIRREIAKSYSEMGYSDVKVDGDFKIENSKAIVEIRVEPGTKKYFGKSIILGNRKTKTSFIYDRLIKKDGSPFNLSIIEQERQSLYRTGLFSKVEIDTQKRGENIDVIYNVEEAAAGAVEFGFGYGEYEKAKGFIEVTYTNLFGVNKQIFSRIEMSSLERRGYLTFVDPWILKDISLRTAVNFEEFYHKNIDTKETLYRLRKVGLVIGAERKIAENFKAELAYEATYSKTWDVKPEILISEHDTGKFFISGIRASFLYDSRDNPFDPYRGWLVSLSAKVSSETLGSELNFLKTSLYLNRYTELINGVVLAKSLRAGWIWTFGDTGVLPIQERYFLGGRTTVRGYAQNMLGPKRNNQPTGGNAFLMGNLEFRASLGRNFFLVNFLDFGNLWNTAGEVNLNALKFTTGLGLRYKTPVGPFRIDYGYKLNRQRDESRGEVHFSFGHAF